jgi:hypothetical protein
MKAAAAIRSLRFWSRTWYVLACVPIAWGIYQYAAFAVWAKARDAHGEFVCGTGLVMLVFACIAATTFCLMVASALAIVRYMRLPPPRPRQQLPILACGVGIFIVSAGAIALLTS